MKNQHLFSTPCHWQTKNLFTKAIYHYPANAFGDFCIKFNPIIFLIKVTAILILIKKIIGLTAAIVVIPKPAKPMGDPKSYWSLSLLCVPYKICKRLIYACIKPLVDPLLPKEQAGFRCGKSTIDQVVLLTQNIEDSFKAKKKAGAVFVNLTAAYDTVWHRGLTCKLLRLLPDKHMVKMIMELVRNRSFTLTTSDSKQSRLRRLKNGVPQRSVLAPLLFNIYMYDLPSTISRKFTYADDLALLHSSENWKDLEGTLS